MAYFVYIIQSETDHSYYKGHTENYLIRLEQHNRGESKYTSRKLPWKLVYVEEMNSKKEAIIRERNLKKATKERTLALITSTKNMIKSG